MYDTLYFTTSHVWLDSTWSSACQGWVEDTVDHGCIVMYATTVLQWVIDDTAKVHLCDNVPFNVCYKIIECQ